MPAAEVRLVVSVKDARNFPLEWLNGNHRPYLQFVLPGAGRGSTAPWLGETQPQWKERFEFMVDPLNDQIALSVGLMDERRKEADATPVAHVAISIMEIFHTSKMQVKLGSAIYSSLADIYLVLNFDHCFPPAPPKSMIDLIARSRAAGPLPQPEEREPVSTGSRSSHNGPMPTSISDAHTDGYSSRPRGREWESPALSPDQAERDRNGRRVPLVSAFPVRSPDRPPQLFLGDSLLTAPSDPAPWNDDWSVVDGHVPSVSDWPQAPFPEASKRPGLSGPYQREDGRPLPDSSFASPKLLKRALLRRQNLAAESDAAAQDIPFTEAFASRERADSDSTKRSLSGGSRRTRSAIVTDPPSTNKRTPSQERDRTVHAEEVPRSPPVRTRSASRRQETSSALPTPVATSASTFRASSPPLLTSPRSGQRTGTNTNFNSAAGLPPFFGSSTRGQVAADGSGGLPRPPSWSVQRGSSRQISTTDAPLPPPPMTAAAPTDSFGSAINLMDPLSSARQMATASRVRRLGRAGGDANPPLP